MGKKETPRFEVRTTGRTTPRQVKRIRWRLKGDHYAGHPNLDVGTAKVDDVSFAGFVFEYLYADGAAFKRCDFSGAAISGSFGVNRQTTFVGCLFDQTRLSNVEPGQARFVGCSFLGADLSGWNAAANEFVDCRFAGLVRRCNFWGAPVDDWLEPGNLRPRRIRNEFRGNDFREAELRDVSFVGGIDIGAQLWPASDDYIRLDRLQERIKRARAIVDSWGDPQARHFATVMLDAYSEAGYEQQEELFANRWSLDVIPKEITARVWTTLEATL